MSQDIVLKAILDTQEIDRTLRHLDKKDFGKVGILGDIIGKDAQRQFNKFESSFNRLKGELETAKTASLFGDINKIKTVNSTLDILIKKQAKSIEQIRTSKDEYEKYFNKLVKGSRFITGGRGIQEITLRRGGLAELEGMYKKDAFSGAAKARVAEILATKEQLVNLEKIERQYARVSKGVVDFGITAKKSMNPVLNMLHQFGIEGTSVGNVFGKLAGKVLTWTIATTSIFAIIGAIKALAAESKALEDAQTSLRKVLDGNAETIERNVKATMRFAKEMNQLTGATFKDTINSVKTAAQAGFTFSDSLKIARASLLSTNIAEMTSEDSTRKLVATIRQFNLEAKDSLWILDQWNELSNKTGAETAELAEAVTRTGKAWQLAGGSLGQLNAIAATTIEATGESGEKIGTMLKTLSARYEDINQRGGFAKALEAKNINIDIYDETTGKFKNIFDIMGKLSGRWSGLEEAQKASIAKAAAGIRQYSRFIAIMDNYDRVIQALAIDINASNSAYAENAKRVNTLDFQLRRLSGMFSEFSSGTGVINFLKLLSLTLKGFGSILNLLINPITILTGLIIGLGVAFTIYHKAALAAAVATKTFLLTNLYGWAILAVGGLLTLGTTLDFFRNKTKDTSEAVSGKIMANAEMLSSYKALIESWASSSSSAITKSEIENTFKNMGINLNAISREVGGDLDKITNKVKNMITKFNDLNSQLKIIREGFSKETEKEKKKTGTKNLLLGLTQLMIPVVGLLTTTTPESAESDFISLVESQLKRTDLSKNEKLYNQLKDLSEKYAAESYKDNKEKAKILEQYNQELRKIGMGALVESDNELQKYLNVILGKYVPNIALVFNRPTTSFNEDDDDETKRKLQQKYKNYVDILKDYYKTVYELSKENYQKNKEFNKALVEGFTTPLFDLSYEGDFGSRILKSMQGVGGKLYKDLTDSINEGIINGLTGEAPKDLSEKIEFALKTGGENVEYNILQAFNIGAGVMDTVMQGWITDLAKLKGVEPSALGINVFKPGVPPNARMLEIEANRLRLNPTSLITTNANRMLGSLSGFSEGISKSVTNAFPFLKGDFLNDVFGGFGIGSFAAEASGRKSVEGGALGGIGSIIGGLLTNSNPVGMLVGGLLGGLLAPQKQEEQNLNEDQTKYARESFKELKQVNRNLTIMIDESKAFQINPESFYFAQNRSRGLTLA